MSIGRRQGFFKLEMNLWLTLYIREGSIGKAKGSVDLEKERRLDWDAVSGVCNYFLVLSQQHLGDWAGFT